MQTSGVQPYLGPRRKRKEDETEGKSTPLRWPLSLRFILCQQHHRRCAILELRVPAQTARFCTQ
jgi:hypothetical protein